MSHNMDDPMSCGCVRCVERRRAPAKLSLTDAVKQYDAKSSDENEGRKAERAAIVKWLRANATGWADAIERGDHHRDAAEERLVEELARAAYAADQDCPDPWEETGPDDRKGWLDAARVMHAHLRAKGLLKEPG